MKTSKPTPRKLKIESLEDRCLTASLGGATAFAPAVSSFQAYELAGPQTPSLTPTVALVRSYDWVSGIRLNHNETLVRDRRTSRTR